MTSGKISIPMKEISRRELPGYERRGVLAQGVLGPEILVITLHQARVDIETLAGVAAEVPPELLEHHPGVSDTVLLGSVTGDGSVVLLDMLMLERKSQRGKAWKDRLMVLEKLYEKLPDAFKKDYFLATTYSMGLMKIFDRIVDAGGAGLLLRIKGQAKAVFCQRR